ncbi:serine protease snake-like isoform X1 [Phlebotomus papatasi]|uniref:serine protease snake-like isoform X1 n=1 Tax=Phlebotomus papatasi TaxID=29031 RepID=UPI002483751D|nr:serine protease snake-like isoform X1 [Phlebotomus papatasi]
MNLVFVKFLFLLQISRCVTEDSILFRDESFEENSSCRTSSGDGICVFAERCRISSGVISNTSPTICYFHEHHIPVICCPKQNVVSDINTEGILNLNKLPTSPNASSESNKVTSLPNILDTTKSPVSSTEALQHLERLSILKCREYSHNFTEEKKTYFGIVLGSNAVHGEFPHMAAIGEEWENQIRFYCGGSLISEKYILTAAHCLTRNIPKIIRLGDIDLSTDEDNENKVQNYGIEKIFIHPEYRSSSVYNDIALIKLNDSVKFTFNVRPACLYISGIFDNIDILTATGWGHTSFIGESSPILQKVYLNTFLFEECSKHYLPTRRLQQGLRKNTQFCAGSSTTMKDTCQGDSGGPLSKPDYQFDIFVNIHYIVGLTSFGRSCGAQIPAVYTNVTSYIDWIEGIAWN